MESREEKGGVNATRSVSPAISRVSLADPDVVICKIEFRYGPETAGNGRLEGAPSRTKYGVNRARFYASHRPDHKSGEVLLVGRDCDARAIPCARRHRRVATRGLV